MGRSLVAARREYWLTALLSSGLIVIGMALLMWGTSGLATLAECGGDWARCGRSAVLRALIGGVCVAGGISLLALCRRHRLPAVPQRRGTPVPNSAGSGNNVPYDLQAPPVRGPVSGAGCAGSGSGCRPGDDLFS